MEAHAMTDEVFAMVELKRVFKAPPEAVYHAWTDPKALAAWMGPDGVSTAVDHMDVRVGGAFRYVMEGEDDNYPAHGTFLEIVPNRRLAFTWAWENGEIAGVEMLVELDFAAVEGGTELTLTHSKLPSETAREKHTEGWTSSFDCLEAYVAG